MSLYPTPEGIVSSLTELASKWRLAAVFWHLYFAVLIAALICGIKPSKRIACLLLALPFLSVSILAFTIFNPVNGIGFALVGILLVYVSLKMPREQVQIAPWWALIAGAFMFVFGWVYPQFLDASSLYSFIYSSPVGIIPCPTLSIGIGLVMILNSLGSRKVSLILGVSGILYGITGVVQLGVTIDLVLLLGSVVMLIIFVIMLLDLEAELRSGLKFTYTKLVGGFLAILFLFGIFYAVVAKSPTGKTGSSYTPENMTSNVKAVGEVLFTQYLFPFEIISVLLVVAWWEQ
jgi:NADH:ubiquinone oxidoreductase subunit 6 (subunit J)